MKVVARKDLVCLILASQVDNEDAEKYYEDICKEIGDKEIKRRLGNLETRGLIEKNGNYFRLTEKGRKKLSDADY